MIAARHRRQAELARHDQRAWVVKRRERTRQLIELGGLVAKAGLVALTDDDRAVIYGALLEVAAKLQGENCKRQMLLWWRRGVRGFAKDDEASASSVQDESAASNR